jgi:hypothetical protein
MPQNLNELESKRESLYDTLTNLGDFRRGTISVNYRKCGKKNCACVIPGHPGHGPQYLWNTTIKGKSYAKSLKFGPELQKYINETENYRRFIELYNEIIKVNEEICDLRPSTLIDDKDEAEALKKKLQMHFKRKLRKK